MNRLVNSIPSPQRGEGNHQQWTLGIFAFVGEERIPFLFFALFAVGWVLGFEKRRLGTEIIAEVALLLVSHPLCLWFLALMFSFFVVEVAVVAAAQIKVALRTGILPVDLLFYLNGLSTFPAIHRVCLPVIF
jgi:hypothetical protein